MKIFLSGLVMIILLVLARQISGADNNSGLLQPIAQPLKKQMPGIDTFYAIKTIFQQGGKTVAKDTFVVIMHEMPTSYPKARAGIKYSLEPVPYNPADTGKTKKAATDTIVWTYKPYKPKP